MITIVSHCFSDFFALTPCIPYSPSGANFTVSLQTQRLPFNGDTVQTFDPNLGRHDAFLLLGRYIFAQKTDSQNVISLHVSYDRKPFKKAMIPATDPHQVSSSSSSSIASMNVLYPAELHGVPYRPAASLGDCAALQLPV